MARSLRHVLREPLLHFAVLGAGIFALHALVAPPPRADRVRVSADFIAGLRQEHTARNGRPPTPEEERALVDRFVDEEILYREATALGLDRGDPIVRRRLAQKMTFVAEDSAAREPTETDLAAYLAAHADRYRDPPRLSFRHVFLARDRRADAAADAARLLPALTAGAAPDTLGDPFLQGASFTLRSAVEIEALFGRAFAQALLTAPADTWIGPLPGSFGSHLVRILDRSPGALPPLGSIRARVRADLLEERRDTAVRDLQKRLRARYRVEIEGPKVAEAR